MEVTNILFKNMKIFRHTMRKYILKCFQKFTLLGGIMNILFF